jgi:hypothetical protein
MGIALKTGRYPFSTVVDPRRMADRIMQFAPATNAEALKLLRASFPNCPLSLRVAALDFLLRRKYREKPRDIGPRYSPR